MPLKCSFSPGRLGAGTALELEMWLFGFGLTRREAVNQATGSWPERIVGREQCFERFLDGYQGGGRGERSGGGSRQYKYIVSDIQMEQIWEGDEEEIQFELREIVWAKITGYPWWPARVTQMPNSKAVHYRVDFFSDNTHAFLPASKLCPYEDMRSDIDLHRNMNKGLRKAVGVADRAFGEREAPYGPGRPSLSVVEGPSSPLKQLLKSPQLTTPLQENNKLQIGAQPHDSPSSPPSDSEEESLTPQVRYSQEQKERYVSNLLKKYNLTHIPRMPQINYSPPKASARQAANPARKRNPVKKVEIKMKNINKANLKQHNYLYLLTRKIYRLLREKGGLSAVQRKEISSSLGKGVIEGGGLEEASAVLKWVMISSSQTIGNYYQSWGCLQGDKEKSSNMTTED